jgi:cytochrome c-type biogenesis protein CcmH
VNPTLSFLLLAALLFLVVVAIVLRPLWRKNSSIGRESATNDETQKASLQESISLIEAEHARGEIDALAADARKREVLLRARAEAPLDVAEGANASGESRVRRGLATSAAIAIAAASVGIYLWLGNPAAMDPAALRPVAQQGEVGPAQVAEMVKRLEAKLSAGPPKAEDLTGWKMLARSQMVMQQFGKAVESYRVALKLSPGNTEIETQLAESLLAQSDGRPSDEIEALLASGYKREPTNPKILWLSAAVAQERGDKPKAVKFLKEARATLPPESEEIKQIDQFIADLSK